MSARVPLPLRIDAVDYVLDRPLLSEVSVAFEPGRLTALSGPSGSGKTTLLSIAGGLLKATSGEARYGDEPVWDGSGDPRPEIAFILQVYGLVPILSALENVSIALRARGVAPDEADERAEVALARVHIADLGARQVEELSGGQMQRVACARGLVVQPDVLLADEPTSELDEANRDLVLSELRREADRGAVVVVATHDPLVVEACDAHIALDEGRVVVAETTPRRRVPAGEGAADATPVSGATPRHRRFDRPDADHAPRATRPTPASTPVPTSAPMPAPTPADLPSDELSDELPHRPGTAPTKPAPAVSPFARPTDDT